MKKKITKRNLFQTSIVTVLIIFLAACMPPGSVPVEPIAIMPEGTNGFPWWNDSVFYQIFVRSFYDSNGDGIGDFSGIIEKLDYLNDGDPETTTDLGVTGIWLMPVFPSPSYHGYDVTDYYTVNPEYGTMDEFQKLIEEAHQRGIRVVIDLVINHTSTQHTWFIESQNADSEKRSWYIWEEESPGFGGPWGQQVWYKHPSGYYYAVFWEGMPDLNLANPDVKNEIIEISRFWLEMGVDGFRLDAAKHLIENGQEQENTELTHDFWEEYRPAYKSVNGNAVTIGEVWSSSEAVSKYLEGDELDLAFEFDLAESIIKSASSNNPFSLRASLLNISRNFPHHQIATFLSNHDQNRVMDRMLLKEEKARLAASVLLTSPGVPFIYYGEEIGMSGSKPDENIRTPMQWSGDMNAGFTIAAQPWRAAKSNYTERNVELQNDDPNSLLSHYRSLIQLRNQHVALRLGDYFEVEVDKPNTLAYLRYSEQESVLVLLNFNADTVENPCLTLRSSKLNETYLSVPLYTTGLDTELKPATIEVGENGSISNFCPIQTETLFPGYAVVILQLQQK
jgi:glycosidase